MSDKIIVIGGGISGLTSALILQLLGHQTEIITDKTVTGAEKEPNPEFASLFPSASVIPHSVYSDRLKDLFILSQSIFYELRKLVFPGLTTHKHYEVFEFEPEPQEYSNWMLNWQPIEDLEPERIPRRNDDTELHGWVFDCMFADWKLYLPAIKKLYIKTGGTVTQRKLKKDDISKLSADTIINCSGTGSPDLFEDPVDNQLIMRGHLLHKSNAPLITNADNEIISYNYTPKASVYADPDGNACDVYCYPRKDGWVLGGSRQVGQLSTKDWDDEYTPVYELDDIKFPKQIIDLNSEILAQTFGQNLDKSDDLTASVGIRYIRDLKDGLRLEAEQNSGKTIIHNYGHGGAGVTLSWGCAVDVAAQLSSQEHPEVKTTLLDKIEEELPSDD